MARFLILAVLVSGCSSSAFTRDEQGAAGAGTGGSGVAGAVGLAGGGGTGGALEAGPDGGAGGAEAAPPDSGTDVKSEEPVEVCSISVHAAVFAGSCDKPTGLHTVSERCDGLRRCDYEFQTLVDPGFDPAYGCSKDLVVDFDCGDGVERHAVDTEAWNGDVLVLECGCDS